MSLLQSQLKCHLVSLKTFLKIMFKFLLVSLEVYLCVIVTDYSRRYEPNLLWRICTFVSAFHLFAAAANIFFAYLS